MPIALASFWAGLCRRPHRKPFFKVLPEGLLARLNVAALIHFGDQPGAFPLRLSFGALERVPFAAPLAGPGVDIEDDRPVAGRALADVTLHGCDLVGRKRVPRALTKPSKPTWIEVLTVLRVGAGQD